MLLLDCEQSLFFFRFSESSARARELPSCAFSQVRGHLRVSRTSEKRETARSLWCFPSTNKKQHNIQHFRIGDIEF